MEEEQREIADAYLRLHYAILRIELYGMLEERPLWAGHDEWWDAYQPLRTRGFQPNDHGIFWLQYALLRMYYHHGGVYLSYDKLIDYFSEEFEPDGTLRLYNNGNHPEIEAFVIWMWEGRRGDEFRKYRESLDAIRVAYFFEHRDAGFRDQPLRQLSPQMFDALARAEADPDYMLDLTSLQEAGY